VPAAFGGVPAVAATAAAAKATAATPATGWKLSVAIGTVSNSWE